MIKNNTLFRALGILCLMFCFFSAKAQTAKDTSAHYDKPGLKLGLSYINNDVFYGRGDTVSTPTVIPLIKYTFASGIYLMADLNYVTNRKKNKLDGGSIGAGYDFTIADGLEGGASFTKLFYNGNSTQVSSANRANFNINLNYDIAGIITPSVSFDHDINRGGVSDDNYINIGLSHDIEVEHVFADDDNLTISPTIEMNSGTQNFYTDYVDRRVTRSKKLTAAQNTQLAAEQAELAKYRLLDYEFSMPVEYQSGRVIINFTPTYALVQNKLPATISSALSSGMHIFYFKIGIALTF